ncbi:zf-C3HC4-domain-containing protein [Auriscalpium vulgare]|uniref:Zf-C3HC4-domain-containing protein n=1 Tax=Auriscalpium vulgare TaxID=40419 RepID=A0ACB8SA01_9AGAM|nr:zf-C3HC4-domain-containing protein [Auriscalpium vulgare]
MADSPKDDKQCRICLDGDDLALGRLIRPCLCKGSISYVHVKCLQRWRNSSPNASAFFSCPQCHYSYRFSRTKVVGIATNPIIIGLVSSTLFTLLVFASSFLTTRFLSVFEEPSTYYASDYYVFAPFWTNPIDVGRELVRAALRIIQDQSGGLFDADALLARTASAAAGDAPAPSGPPGLIRRFIQRFVLGLPIVGAGSLVHMLLSMPLLGPVHWIARFRGGRSRRNNNSSRDIAAIVVVVLLLVGAARAVYKVYRLTESVSKRVLLRAEDAILEVNG